MSTEFPGIAPDLLTRLRAGEERAYIDFVAQWQPWFARDLRRRGFTPAEAADLGYDCSTHALIKLEKYPRGMDGFDAWVRTVGRNHATDWRRKNPRFAEFDRPERIADRRAGTAEEEAPKPEPFRVKLLAIMSSLPEKDRLLIEMRYLRGVADFEAIGAALGIKPGAARTRHHRILQKLKASA